MSRLKFHHVDTPLWAKGLSLLVKAHGEPSKPQGHGEAVPQQGPLEP